MRKLLIASVLLFSLMLMVKVALANAPAKTPDYWHTNDYYDVELGGSGNAFISGTINLESISGNNVTKLKLEIPYTDVTVYKVASGGGYYYPPPCYGDPCPVYNQQYYEPTFLNYTTEAMADSTVVNIDLPYMISNGQSSTIYFIFSTHQVARPVFQGWEFNFNTPKDPAALIRDIGANIYVPQNMQLKGKPQFDINYKPYLASASTSMAAREMIGYFPQYRPSNQYSAQNLAPGESFTVKGLYGKDVILLYLQEIAEGIAVLIVLIILIKYVVLSRTRNLFKRTERGAEGFRRQASEFSFLRALIVGSFSGFLFVIVYFMLTYLTQFMNFGYYNFQFPLIILFFTLAFLLEGIALFGLPFYLYRSYNKTEGFVAGIISIIVGFAIFVLLAYLFSSQPIYGGFTGAQTQVVTGAPGVNTS